MNTYKVRTVPLSCAFKCGDHSYFRNRDGSYVDEDGDFCNFLGHELDNEVKDVRVLSFHPFVRYSSLGESDVFCHGGNAYICDQENEGDYDDYNTSISLLPSSFVYLLFNNSADGEVKMTNAQPVTDLINIDDYFRKVDKCVYDFRSGQLGVTREDGKGFSVFSLPKTKTGKPSIQSCELSAFGTKMPAYAMRTPITKLSVGDVVILTDNTGAEKWLYYLTNEKDGSTTNYEVTGIEADSGTKISISVQDGLLLGGDSVLSVKNFLGDSKMMKNMMLPLMLMSQSSQGQGGMNNILPLMMMGGESGDMQSMLPLLLMSGGATGGGGDQTTMLMAMMMMNKDGGAGAMDMQKMLPLMLLTQGNQGGGNNNMLLMLMMMGGNNPFAPAEPTPSK